MRIHSPSSEATFLTDNAACPVEQELRRVDPSGKIVIGTATYPFQPVKRTAQIKETHLRLFARRRGDWTGIATKSPLITQDLELLRELAKYNM